MLHINGANQRGVVSLAIKAKIINFMCSINQDKKNITIYIYRLDYKELQCHKWKIYYKFLFKVYKVMGHISDIPKSLLKVIRIET